MTYTILLTGGLGFIGSHICVELLTLGHCVVIIDNLSNSSVTVLDSIRTITGLTPAFYQLDARDPGIRIVFDNHRIDSVIHLAGLKSVNESIRCPIKYYDQNINSTLNLLQVMEKYECHDLIFSSSATVYGSANVPLTEQSIIGQGITNPYGETKFMIEKMLMSVSESDSKWNIVSLRYFNPIGAHDSGLIGENPNDIPNNLMPYIMRVAAKNNNQNSSLSDAYNKLNIFGNDYKTSDGTCSRDYIHVVDLALAHVKSLQYIQCNDNGYNYFNIGTGKGTSVLDLVNTFASVNNCILPYEFTDRRTGDLPIIYCDNSLAMNVLEWKPLKTLQDMCMDSWNYQNKN
jgi:UDP-glucose 4-epimerase